MSQTKQQKLHSIITWLLHLYDPAYLNDSCPVDEYEFEAYQILSLKLDSKDELSKAIYEVFATTIGQEHIAPKEDSLYETLAKEIIFAKEAVYEKTKD